MSTGLLFSSFVFADKVHAENIVFDNLSGQVVLLKKASNYLVEGTDLKVVLSDRIIVKTTVDIRKSDLYAYHSQVKKVTELFKGSVQNYFSLTLRDGNELNAVLKFFRRLQHNNVKGIKLVQPDLLQLKTKAEALANKYKSSPYVELMGIPSLWKKTKGEGIKVAIIDDGFNLSHPDLRVIVPVFSYDVDTRTVNPTMLSRNDSHGTKVAGIIFATHNKQGIDGIAPNADFIAIRQPTTWVSNTLLSFQLAKLAGASIINCSWHTNLLMQPVADVVNELTQFGRKGKGIAVIFAAGNQGLEVLKGDSEAAIENAIVVGANDKNFIPLNFSNYGRFIDLWAYGKGVKTTVVSGRYGVFAGTSLAAAIVSGVSALILSQSPEITLKELSQKLKLLIETQKAVLIS